MYEVYGQPEASLWGAFYGLGTFGRADERGGGDYERADAVYGAPGRNVLGREEHDGQGPGPA